MNSPNTDQKHCTVFYDTDSDGFKYQDPDGNTYTFASDSVRMKKDLDRPGHMSLDNLKNWRIPIEKDIIDHYRDIFDVTEEVAYVYLAMVDSMYQNIRADDCEEFIPAYRGATSRGYLDLNDTPVTIDHVIDSALQAHKTTIPSDVRDFVTYCHLGMVDTYSTHDADPGDSYLVVWVS